MQHLQKRETDTRWRKIRWQRVGDFSGIPALLGTVSLMIDGESTEVTAKSESRPVLIDVEHPAAEGDFQSSASNKRTLSILTDMAMAKMAREHS